MNIGKEDVVLVKQLGSSGANKLRPVLIILSSENKKKKFFKNIGIWRSECMKERDPNDETSYDTASKRYSLHAVELSHRSGKPL